ncbi:MAG: hypothetical protein IBX61_02620 [Thermoleophilia bacterium]|nr:hypothetical protein [Thermoleophilia bacterium]
MDCYLCTHCKTIANFPLTGHCEESPTSEHECVTGDEMEEYLLTARDRHLQI